MAIHLDASATGFERPIRWAYRVLALLWIGKGLLGWASLMGFDGHDADFAKIVGWTGFFVPIVVPVIDLIAGVALWISWRWGAGVWALAALGYLCLEAFGAVTFPSRGMTAVVFVLLILHFVRLVLIRSKSEQQMTIV
jgi:hypothetical protein